MIDRKGWIKVKFGDVVRQVKNKVAPETSGLERFVAGEHMTTDDLRIRSWGTIGDGYLGPAFNTHFKSGQVLYGSRRTYLRKVALADFEGICANTTFVLESKDPTVLLPELLPFIMQTQSFNEHSVKQSKGSVNPYVNFSDLAWFEFNLPPLEEQQLAINFVLASTDSGNALEDASFAGERLLKAYRDEIIGGCNAASARDLSLSDLLLGSPESGCSAPSLDADTGHFVLGLAALSRHGYVSGDFKPVEPTNKMMSAKLFKGDLLISRSNTVERVGYVGIFNDDRDDVSFPDTMMRLQPNCTLVEPPYLEALLQTSAAREFLTRIAAGTSASMKKINRENLLKMPVRIPRREDQLAVLSVLSKLKRALALQRSRLLTARLLTKQIVERLIAGEA